MVVSSFSAGEISQQPALSHIRELLLVLTQQMGQGVEWRVLPGVIYGKLFSSNEDLSFWFIVWLDAQSRKLAKSTAVLLKIKGPSSTHRPQGPKNASYVHPSVDSINPLSPNSNQHQFSPNNIHTLSRDTVMRINKVITKGKISTYTLRK